MSSHEISHEIEPTIAGDEVSPTPPVVEQEIVVPKPEKKKRLVLIQTPDPDVRIKIEKGFQINWEEKPVVREFTRFVRDVRRYVKAYRREKTYEEKRNVLKQKIGEIYNQHPWLNNLQDEKENFTANIYYQVPPVELHPEDPEDKKILEGIKEEIPQYFDLIFRPSCTLDKEMYYKLRKAVIKEPIPQVEKLIMEAEENKFLVIRTGSLDKEK